MNQGNISEWKIEEGQELAAGDVIAEIETDKATMDWESQDDGYVAKILVAGGTKDIPVGTTVAIMVEDKDDAGAFADYKGGEDSASDPSGGATAAEDSQGGEEKEAASSGGGGGSYPPYTPLEMPALSPTMSAGNIAKWNVKVGDEITAGDSIAEIETDKATMDWESQDDGFIAALLVEDGASNIDVNTPVAVMVEDEASVAAFKGVTAADLAGSGKKAFPPSSQGDKSQSAPKQEKAASSVQQAPRTSERTFRVRSARPGERVVASPYARKLAAEAGVDIADATPSGSNNQVVAADVEKLIASGGSKQKSAAPAAGKQEANRGAPAPGQQGGGAEVPSRRDGGFTDTPNTNIRRITAARLLESKQSIPHYYVTSTVRVDKLMALRKQINDALAASGGGKLSVNDFIVKASALALRDVPEVNSAWMGDFIRQYDDVHVSVAVQTPHGLMVPVIRNTDRLGLSDINAEVKMLASKAKDNKLTPDQMTGGTFTISNLGMYGVHDFCAIINPPQVCILAVGGAVEKVVSAPGGGFEAALFINATLSCDHRVVDGALGAQWLQAFKKRIESPLEMLI